MDRRIATELRRAACGALLVLLGTAGVAAAQPYGPGGPPPDYPPPGYGGPPPGYGRPPPDYRGPPPGYGPPPGFHCAAVSHTPIGPHRVFCELTEPRPIDEQCFCPIPPPLPGLPPLPPARGHVVR